MSEFEFPDDVPLVATKELRYRTRRLVAEDPFSASPKDAKILKAIRKARDPDAKSEAKPAPAPTPEPVVVQPPEPVVQPPEPVVEEVKTEVPAPAPEPEQKQADKPQNNQPRRR